MASFGVSLIIPNIAIADDDVDDDLLEIYQNCVIDLTPENPSKEIESAIHYKCLRIATNPSRWQKWKYSD